MGIVSALKNYKLLRLLNKYSLMLIYVFSSLILIYLLLSINKSRAGLFVVLIFISLSLYFGYFVVTNKRRNEIYDFDNIFPLKDKDYLLVEFSSIYCAGCLPVRRAVDRISTKYNNIQILQIEARNLDKKYQELVNKLNLSVTPTICLLDKQGEVVSKRLAHFKPEIVGKKLDGILGDSIS
jgi:thiol-disulfide isomerase/thioredoxin